jgi:hypothetical protein
MKLVELAGSGGVSVLRIVAHSDACVCRGCGVWNAAHRTDFAEALHARKIVVH